MKRYKGSLTGVWTIGSIDQMPTPMFFAKRQHHKRRRQDMVSLTQKLMVFRKSALLRIANPYMPKEDTCIEAPARNAEDGSCDNRMALPQAISTC